MLLRSPPLKLLIHTFICESRVVVPVFLGQVCVTCGGTLPLLPTNCYSLRAKRVGHWMALIATQYLKIARPFVPEPFVVQVMHIKLAWVEFALATLASEVGVLLHGSRNIAPLG